MRVTCHDPSKGYSYNLNVCNPIRGCAKNSLEAQGLWPSHQLPAAIAKIRCLDLTNVNLKLLHTFLLAAEQESFRKAADESNRSPSAVSMQIRGLEEQIGVPLFRRTPQKVILTPEGRALFDQVRRAVREVQAGLDQLADAAQSRRGHIRIACVPTLASTRLPNILATFRVRYPRSLVEVREISTAAILDLLRNHEVEFGLAPAIPNMGEFLFEPILDDPLYACIPPALDDGKEMLGLADLSGQPCIVLSPSTALRGTIDSALDALGVKLDVQFEVQQATTAMALASAGLGIAILPKIAMLQVSAPQFRVVPITDSAVHRKVGLITARGYIQHPTCAQLMNLICASLRQPQ
jgi:DNA-binding transcriptional LysR family regulator